MRSSVLTAILNTALLSIRISAGSLRPVEGPVVVRSSSVAPVGVDVRGDDAVRVRTRPVPRHRRRRPTGCSCRGRSSR